MTLSVELSNPSAFHALRVFTQNRASNVVTPAAKPKTAKRETRAELEKRGAETTMKPTRIMAMVDGSPRSVTRELPVPLWQAEGAESLNEWCTHILDKMADDARKGPPVNAQPVQRVVDSWLARVPFGSVPPGGKAQLILSEERRYLIECDEEAALAIANTSSIRTLRLRNVETITGETTNTRHIAPARDYAQCAVVVANGKTAAVIELQPT
jgi:hypothetical protein